MQSEHLLARDVTIPVYIDDTRNSVSRCHPAKEEILVTGAIVLVPSIDFMDDITMPDALCLKVYRWVPGMPR